jgi:hypothetical protein
MRNHPMETTLSRSEIDGQPAKALPGALRSRGSGGQLQLVPLLLGLLLSGCGSPRAGSSDASAVSVRPYPLDTCLVTENALGSMGDPIVMVHAGQEVKFCCAPCVEEFKANPEEYLARLE